MNRRMLSFVFYSIFNSRKSYIMSKRIIFVLYIIDFRKFEFGYTAFMHFPLLHKALSSKKRMKSNEGEEFTHTKARTLSTLTELFKKNFKNRFWVQSSVKCVTGRFA